MDAGSRLFRVGVAGARPVPVALVAGELKRGKRGFAIVVFKPWASYLRSCVPEGRAAGSGARSLLPSLHQPEGNVMLHGIAVCLLTFVVYM